MTFECQETHVPIGQGVQRTSDLPNSRATLMPRLYLLSPPQYQGLILTCRLGAVNSDYSENQHDA